MNIETVEIETVAREEQVPDQKVNLNDTFDAQIWAQEWLKTIEKYPDIPTDEGTMLGWFANAIMAGYDHAYREMQTKNASKLTWASNRS